MLKWFWGCLRTEHYETHTSFDIDWIECSELNRMFTFPNWTRLIQGDSKFLLKTVSFKMAAGSWTTMIYAMQIILLDALI